MSSGVVVTSSWPIVVLVCPPAFDANWVSALDTSFQTVFAREAPFALITDTSAVSSSRARGNESSSASGRRVPISSRCRSV
jgi:hypothetical protein